MGMLEDVIKALERIPLWKQVSVLPARVEQLEARIASLEAQLAGKPGALCPMCNATGFARTASKPDPVFGATGLMLDSYRCPDCGHAEDRPRDTMR